MRYVRSNRALASLASLASLVPALALSLAFVMSIAPASAQESTPAPSANVEALARAHAAVVGVEVKIDEDAPSAQTLGRTRSGSGVVIGPDGLILTIGYLMLEAENITITTSEGRTLPARSVGYDVATGFGLLRPLVPLRLEAVPLGTVEGLEAGDALMVAIGGDGGGVAITRFISSRAFSGYWEYHIERSLFASPPVGNHSGAPVFNRRGELLGVGSLFVMDARGDGRRLPGNMYVPVDLLKPILAELQSSGTTRQSHRPWIGVNAVDDNGRVRIVRVSKDSPAQAAGLDAGDVVTAVDGVAVDTLERFYKKLWDRADPAGEVHLTVRQGAQERELTLRGVDRMTTVRKPAGI